jgi:hypothetical protein
VPTAKSGSEEKYSTAAARKARRYSDRAECSSNPHFLLESHRMGAGLHYLLKSSPQQTFAQIVQACPPQGGKQLWDEWF